MINKILRKLSSFRRRQNQSNLSSIESKYQNFDISSFTNLNPEYKKFDIGDFTYGFPEIIDMSDYDDIANQPTKLIVGKYCSIGPWVKIILGSEHRQDWISTYPFNALNENFRKIKGHPHSRGDISIGNDVWLGANVTILSGVTIGDGAIVGANSLVMNSILPYTIAVGTPAKQLKKRFSQDNIEFLLNLKWWEWDTTKINSIIPLLQSSDFNALKNI